MDKIKNENYINIQGFMVNELGLKGNELLIYAIIYGFSQDENSEFSGGLKYLMAWTQTTKTTCINALKSLIKKGLIIPNEYIKNNVKYINYIVNTGGGIKITPGWYKNYTRGGVKITPINKYNNKNINNKNINNKKYNQRKYDDLNKFYNNI